MGRPKTQTLRLCNQRTKRYELANCSSCTIAVQYRQCKFAQIPCKSYHGTIVCTNANYILARSCENGEDENANPLFVQSTHKAVRACKLFLLHHRLIMQSMEIRSNSRKPYHGTIVCTNANYILARSCENGEEENANPLFVQSTHKAVRACKLFLLHHRLIMQSMEIRSNSRKPYHGTIVALMQSSY